MRTSIFRDLVLLSIIALALFAGGYYAVKYFIPNEINFTDSLSIQQEEELGDLLKTSLLTNMEEISNPTLDSGVQAVTSRLLHSLDSSGYTYHFRVLDNEDVNAFTIPGGNIYIFSGLIRMCESPEELSAVLAHEIAHAEKRHVVDKIIKEFSLSALVTVLSGGDPSLVVKVLQQVIGSSFDRKQEEEADGFALELLEHSRIDPKYMGIFFQRLNDKGLSYSQNLELVMTHPHNDKRIAMSRGYLTKKSFKSEKIEIDWNKVVNSLEEE